MSELPQMPFWPDYWRPATSEADARFAQRLVESTMAPYWRARQMVFSKQLFRQQWRRIEKAILVQQGEAVGLIAWDAHEDIHHLRELHLIECWRGRGLGKRTLEDWIVRQRSLGARTFRLKVFADNPARRLYERVGFRPAYQSSDISGLMGMSLSVDALP
ncbi:GNAT family N-acetyltransferase [Kushneria phosphatilytica]|uniref:GNAT family N-acetyltransferase n=1 Tax=Kushneria phosphatilytica TaxID=657387 RepID=A0A5C0ZZE6_9GAMM|nr:GNAT family N-acetyltransferase [Kushneria phosphatilytica]QEL10773.1 GNAT family N-acetyltransferase [Kushneria phosphatilytica]